MSRRLKTAARTAFVVALVGAAGSSYGAHVAVSANELCYGAGVSGTITGSHDTPPLCLITNEPVLCTTPSAGLDPTIGVHAEACVPV